MHIKKALSLPSSFSLIGSVVHEKLGRVYMYIGSDKQVYYQIEGKPEYYIFNLREPIEGIDMLLEKDLRNY